ncbi:MAG TPA: riboflavin synthase [Gemmatimonadaceae bacterium]|nr:riboflavin synthase [Gemmatimonadaceae bacterium]
MFTGLIDDVGTIEKVTPTAAGREFRVRCRYDDLAEGESIAVNGACLTVRGRGANWFSAAAVTTTLGRTTMGSWQSGRRVNLERAIRAGDRFGGHMVQGHVDGVARVTGVRTAGDARLVDLAVPPGLTDLMVRHGSIAVDGVSLTINDLPVPEIVQLSLIEYTLRHTALETLHAGDEVHVEADMIGKFVQKMIGVYRA